GFGPRQPFVVISPYAKRNYVDHNLSNLASVVNFVEFNWRLPSIGGSADQIQSSVDQHERVPFDLAGLFRFDRGWFGDENTKLFLNPVTGQPVGHGHEHGRRHRHR
ncbi:MAG: alkaline phosphatase family protein, partial [Solirubrobacteraceae bacterium]